MNTYKIYPKLVSLIGLILILALGFGNAQASPRHQTEVDVASIDAYVAEQVNDLNIPGLALGIVRDGQIAHLRGFGAADSTGRAVTPQTPFFIGSVTKSFTALAVMQLVEAGKIDLDAPVKTYLPWFELADKEASEEITVRHLLNQTSGFSTKAGNSFWASKQGLEETVRGLDNLSLTQPVGSTYQYSNLNFMIAGLIVEKVSGLSYAEYVSQHIFEPLDMRHSHTTRSAALADGLAKEHYYMFGQVFESKGPQPPANLPAGMLISSVEDMTHYAIAQLNDGRFGDTSVLSPQGMSELHGPAIPAWEGNTYAMGWNVGTLEGTQSIWHSGDDGRSHALVLLMPDRGSGIVLLANASGFVQRYQVDDIAMSVLGMLDGKPPVSVSLPFLMQFLYWAVLLTPLLMILGVALVWRSRWHAGKWRLILMVVLYLAAAFFIPRFALSEITLRSMLVFHSELGYGLIAIETLGIGWSVIYTAIYLRSRNSRPDLAPLSVVRAYEAGSR